MKFPGKPLLCQRLGGFKSCFAIVIFAIAPLALSAQVGVGTDTPDPSAQLDVTASNKGLLPPRVEDRNAVQNPADGLIVYQTSNERGLWMYDANIPAWVRLAKTSDISPAGGTIIPFASGQTFAISSKSSDGLPETPAFVGFGTSAPGPTMHQSGTVKLNTMNSHLAFSMPRDGILTGFSAFFNITTALTVMGTTIYITAELYEAGTTDNNFNPVPGARVTLGPSLTGTINAGSIVTETKTDMSVPLTAAKRYLMVFHLNSSGMTLNNTLSGYASGGITIQ